MLKTIPSKSYADKNKFISKNKTIFEGTVKFLHLHKFICPDQFPIPTLNKLALTLKNKTVYTYCLGS